jgi:hypothetical protein
VLASALTFASAVLGVSPAHAVPASSIPLECGTRAAFDGELLKRLPYIQPSSVLVSITPALGHYHLRVQIGSELRELDDASCAELFRASVVVAVAMLLHQPSKNEAAPTAPPRATSAPSPPRYPRFAIGAGAGLAFGTLPSPVLALELESKAYWQYLGLSVSLRYLAPTEKVDDQAKRVELQALGAGITGLFRPSRLWEARLGFAAQRLSGQGAGGIAQPLDDSVWVAGPTLGLAFIPVQAGPFWAGLGAEGQLNALRGRFEILHYSQNVTGPPREFYRVPWLAASAFVRLGLVW